MSKLFDAQAEALTNSTTYIHNHEASAVWEIIVKSAIAAAAPFAIWYAGRFFLEQAGVKNPGSAMAEAVVAVLAIAFVLGVLSWFLGDKLDRFYAHRESMADKLTAQLNMQSVMQQSAVTDSRQSGEKARFVALVYAVMWKAYNYHQQNNGQPFRGTWRPWSGREAGKEVLHGMGESMPVGRTYAAQVQSFLENNRIVVDNQLNVAEFPNMAAVQRLLAYPLVVKEEKTK